MTGFFSRPSVRLFGPSITAVLLTTFLGVLGWAASDIRSALKEIQATQAVQGTKIDVLSTKVDANRERSDDAIAAIRIEMNRLFAMMDRQ